MIQNAVRGGFSSAPVVTEMHVIPVAGHDSMLLNLSGAHGPFFTRNIVILKTMPAMSASARCRAAKRSVRRSRTRAPLSSARQSAPTTTSCNTMRPQFADRDAGGRGLQTFDLRIDDSRGHGDRSCAARPARAVSRRARRRAARRRTAARCRRDARLSLLCRRPRQDRPAYRASADGRNDWLRLRHEEALTPEAIVRLAEAAHDRYGFKDFKLKGGVLRGEEEMEAVTALAERFPEARITLDPNGAWSLEEAIRLCKGQDDSSPMPRILRRRERLIRAAKSWRNSAAPPACRPRPT